MIAQIIENLRLGSGLSQQDVATKLGVARATYIKLEGGTRSPTLDELRLLAQLYEVSLDKLISGLPEKEIATEHVTEIVVDGSGKSENDEILIPTEDKDKFKQVLLYVLEKVGAKPNVGETVLYKLLYFIDFDYFEKFQEQLTGAKYIRNHFGPTPISFKQVINEMKNANQIDVTTGNFFKYKQRKYMPMVRPDLKTLDARQLEHIDEVLSRLSDKTASELSDLSHKDVPWRVAKDRNPINYMSVFYRTKETSVRDHSNDEL